MCLIAHRPAGVKTNIPDDVIEYNLRSNPDGFGIAWRDPDQGLLYDKFAPREASSFVGLLKSIDATEWEYTAHWRKATHGTVDREMSHPYDYVSEGGKAYLLFHNGIIDIDCEKGKSDTWQFANAVLPRLPERWWENSAIKYLVEEAIGWSRMIIMDFDSDENIFLKRDDFREMDGGMLYSTYPKGYSSAATTTATATSAATKGQWVTQSPGIEHYIPANAESLAKPTAAIGWLHAGHVVTPISQTQDLLGSDEDLYGRVRCGVCKTEGDFMIIEGQRYIDITHKVAYFEDEADELIYAMDRAH